MLGLLRPDMCFHSVSLIPVKQLQEMGISGVIIDLDNTITEWALETIDPETEKWIGNLPQYNIETCLVSNNRRRKVCNVAERLGISYVCNAGKPRRKAFRQAMDLLGTSPEKTAVVGDQIFTDILGGNRLGLLTILVVPLNSNEFIGTQLVRKFELMLINYLKISRGASK